MSFKELPAVKYVRVNAMQDRARSFIDREYVFTYIKRGRWEFGLHDRVYPVRPGNVLLFPPYLVHGVAPVGRGAAVQYVVHFTMVDQDESVRKLPLVLAPPREDATRIERLFATLRAEWQAARKGVEPIAGGIMAEMLGLYIRHAETEPVFQRRRLKCWQNLERSIQFIRRHYGQALTMEQIAQSAGLSLSHFSHVFKQSFGMSPHAYLNVHRVEAAQKLLFEGVYNCSQIAELTGFSGVHAFSRIFRRIVGASPTQWMKDARIR
ncbi:MAG: helix-turn-helix transcriptional regulator [Kiritimatiellae bacterium]|nr:helix-turn-helix transcriptional regulator [Kiritimatiellia bacterium]